MKKVVSTVKSSRVFISAVPFSMRMLKEFKEFAIKGNMIDMAVGIIIGWAFGTVVKSLVDDVMMPVVSWLFKAPDFSNLFVMLSNPTQQDFTSVEAARESGASVLAYGQFINSFIAFTIMAFCLFMIIKTINKLKRNEEKKEKKVETPKGPSEVEVLLEIKELLRKK